MSAVRHLSAALGVAALCLALVAALAPSAVPVSGPVEAFGTDYLVAAAVGAAALALVLAVFAAWLVAGVDQTRPPDPERVPSGPRPGAEFDRLVADGWGLRTRLFVDRRRVRERLRETAVRTLVRTAGCSRTDARRRVDGGTWTDDTEAAAFLAGEDGPSVPPRARLAALLRGESWARRGARRAGAEIARRAGGVDRA